MYENLTIYNFYQKYSCDINLLQICTNEVNTDYYIQYKNKEEDIEFKNAFITILITKILKKLDEFESMTNHQKLEFYAENYEDNDEDRFKGMAKRYKNEVREKAILIYNTLKSI